MEITVKWSGISNASIQFYGFASDVGNYTASIRTLVNNLKIPNKVKYQIKYAVNAKCDSLNNVQKKLRNMGSVLNQAQNQYKTTENQIVANGKATIIGIPQAVISMPSTSSSGLDNFNFAGINLIDAIWKNASGLGFGALGAVVGGILGNGAASFVGAGKNSNILDMKMQGSLASGSKTVNGNIFGIASSGTATGSFIEGYLKAGVTSKKGEIVGEIAGEGHLAKGKYEGNIGLLSGSIEGTIGQIEGSGKVGVSLFKDGKLSPSIEAELKAEVTGAKVSANSTFGTDDYNAHVNANAKFLNANAEASGAVGVIRTVDENGKEKVEFGAKGTVGTEAYLAEGEIKGGFTIFGIDIDIGLKGKAGGAGVKAEGKATTGGVSGEIGFGLGIGGGMKIDIDWSGFKLF